MTPPTSTPTTDDVLATLRTLQALDLPAHGGRTLAYVYDSGLADADAVGLEALAMFASSNGLDPTAFPSLLRMENDLVALAGGLLDAPEGFAGSVTSGGTESILLAVLAGTAAFCAADEWLTRGVGARRGAYALTKLLFLLSLVLAIALNPGRLFFLAIIVPVILAFLVVYGLFSLWAYRRTWQPMVGALATALAFAWAIAAVFPVVG